MIQDSLAIFATAQTTTTSVAHTDIIDTLAKGDSYEGAFFVFQVSTAFTQVGTASRLTVQLQSSDVSTFNDTSDVTVVQSAPFATASLTAGKMWAVRIPAGTKRYIRAYNSVSGTSAGAAAFSGGAWNSFIAADIDVGINRRYLLQ